MLLCWAERAKEKIMEQQIETNKTIEKGKAERFKKTLCSVARPVVAVVAIVFFIWYCAHPEYYYERKFTELLHIRRTYIVAAISVFMAVLALIPNRLSERVNRIFSWIWFLASPFVVYFSLLYMNSEIFSIHFTRLSKIAVVFTFWFLVLIALFLLVLTGSLRISVLLMQVMIATLGIANIFVYQFRGRALSSMDLFSLGTALTVAGNYEFVVDWYIFAEIFLTFFICVVSCKFRGFRVVNWKIRGAIFCAWLALTGVFYHTCCKTDFLERHNIRSMGYNHQARYKKYDMLFTTLLTCFYMTAEKPEGYSLEKVKELAEPYIEDTGDEAYDTPNVIVVMNESFVDYTDVGEGLELSSDNMPFIRSLEENTIKGSFYSSIFGGNTPNSEYEFLTGNTIGFLPDSAVGFHLFVRGNMPSLASEYKAAGYNALAMHPYRRDNYRRHIVYPQIGFDNYYSKKDFVDPVHIRKYISDQSLVERIIEEYEKNKESGNQFFSWNVTVQNHGGYSIHEIDNLDMSIQVLNEGIDAEQAQIHTNLIKASDEAFEYLVNYFADQDDPTVIIMFGDHQAKLDDSTYEYLIGDEEELTAEELMEKYKVPFVCWANYDIEDGGAVIEKTSLNYLYSILADRLKLPMTGYQRYLLDLQEEIPVLNAIGYWTKDGDFYELSDKTSPYFDLVNDYNILEYNYILGGKNRYLELFNLAS